jgi:hypothetical protein
MYKHVYSNTVEHCRSEVVLFIKAMYLDSGERAAVEGRTIIKDIRTEQEAHHNRVEDGMLLVFSLPTQIGTWKLHEVILIVM